MGAARRPSASATSRPGSGGPGLRLGLGWTFDGLELHLYTLVATPFVAELLSVDARDDAVGYYSSLIQGAFLLGWALGGGLFGWAGDRMGRSRTLVLTILTYALFTGGSYFAANWWHLLIFRFLRRWGSVENGLSERRCSARRGLAAGGLGSLPCFRRALMSVSSWP